MISKETLIKSINDLPNTFSIDDVMDKLLLIEKVQKGLEQSDLGQVYSKKEAIKKLGKWLK